MTCCRASIASMHQEAASLLKGKRGQNLHTPRSKAALILQEFDLSKMAKSLASQNAKLEELEAKARANPGWSEAEMEDKRLTAEHGRRENGKLGLMYAPPPHPHPLSLPVPNFCSFWP